MGISGQRGLIRGPGFGELMKCDQRASVAFAGEQRKSALEPSANIQVRDDFDVVITMFTVVFIIIVLVGWLRV